jgi:hypothetical protein
VSETYLEGARNMKLLLYMFEMIVGLKINFSKSELFNFAAEILLE